jgi:hypothetical protein
MSPPLLSYSYIISLYKRILFILLLHKHKIDQYQTMKLYTLCATHILFSLPVLAMHILPLLLSTADCLLLVRKDTRPVLNHTKPNPFILTSLHSFTFYTLIPSKQFLFQVSLYLLQWNKLSLTRKHSPPTTIPHPH